MTDPAPLRIVAVSELWLGADDRAYVRAFERAGHSVRVVTPSAHVPGRWRSAPLRALRRALEPLLVRDLAAAVVAEVEAHRAQLLFVFKGRYVRPDAIDRARAAGAVAINVYPDVSFLAHGRLIPRALPRYDWVFTTKSFGLDDMRRELGVTRASFIAPCFDPEVHAPVELDPDDRARYGCDVSFIGTWSPKKERLLRAVAAGLPGARLRVWGEQWDRAGGLPVEGRGVLGREFAKALVASRVNLALLSEARAGASSGDRITARTFHIPATGAFMLHERTAELAGFFRDGEEVGTFLGEDDLAAAARSWLEDDARRARVAAAGRARCLADHAVDLRAAEVVARARELVGARPRGRP